MKVCSNCLKCYDDSIETCPAEGHPMLTDLRSGDPLVIEGYRIDSQIESDSPVVRFRATHLASGKKVSAEFISREDSASALEDEMRAAADLVHPNIARVFDFGEVSKDELFVLYEAAPGESLRCFLEKPAPISELQSVEIIRQVAEGLEEIHSASLIHRAVSPENIFVTSSSDSELSVKLGNMDFGEVAQKAVAAGANGVDARTEILKYFSPEQLSGKEIDFKSDLYSLAVVFYELLLGRSPYISFDPVTIADFVFNESDLKDLHMDLRALAAYSLREAFQQRLDLRPKTTNSFVRQLRHLEQIATKIAAKTAGRLENSATDLPKEKPHFNIVEPKERQPMAAAFGRETLVSNHESAALENIPQNETSGLFPKEEKFEKDELKNVSQEEMVPKQEPEIELNEPKVDEAIPVLDFVLQPRNVVPKKTVPVEREEPEPAAEPIEKEVPTAPRAIGSFESYSQAHLPKVNKIFLYMAGILVSAVFGGVLTVGILDWRIATLSEGAAPKISIQSKEKTLEDKKSELVDMNDGEFDVDRKQAEPENIDNELSGSAIRVSSARRTSNTVGAKKVRLKRGVKRKRKSRRKKPPAPVVKTSVKTRPRIVSNVVITY